MACNCRVSMLHIKVSLNATAMGGLSLTSVLFTTVSIHPLSLSTISCTCLIPIVLYFQVGFFTCDVSALVVSSPKFQLHLLGVPYFDLVVSINCKGNSTQVPCT